MIWNGTKFDDLAVPTTFECLCGFATTANCHFILLGVYRSSSQPATVGDFFR